MLKPGQVFACYEWCLTPAYDKGDAAHRLIKKQIEEGDGLPDTAYTWEMDEALRKVSRAADSFMYAQYKQASEGSTDRARPCLPACLPVCLSVCRTLSTGPGMSHESLQSNWSLSLCVFVPARRLTHPPNPIQSTHPLMTPHPQVGFEIVETKDVALSPSELQQAGGGQTWYLPLTPSYNIFSQRFQFTPVGMPLTTVLLRCLEFMRLAPTGTSKVQTMLQQGAIGLAKGGELGIFTPMYLCVARKPLGAAGGAAARGGKAARGDSL